MVNTKCEDPKWQRDKGVDTFYPHATTCFKDPSEGIDIMYDDDMICTLLCPILEIAKLKMFFLIQFYVNGDDRRTSNNSIMFHI